MNRCVLVSGGIAAAGGLSTATALTWHQPFASAPLLVLAGFFVLLALGFWK